MDLLPTFLSKRIICLSWGKTGLFPLNPKVFQEEDFAPSHTFLVKGHLPASYPSVQLVDSNTDGSAFKHRQLQRGHNSADEPISEREP
ncbi:hypothetical protein BDV93DRAFT_573825, partial [Ceratobasidium sp. AG-I]